MNERRRADDRLLHRDGDLLVIPLLDEPVGEVRIYDSSIPRFALLGALVAGLLFGVLGWALASGALPVAGLGQFAAAGVEVGTFVGAGLGAALGGLAGGLAAVFRLPSAREQLDALDPEEDKLDGDPSPGIG